MVNVGWAQPIHAHRARRRAGQHAFARAHFAVSSTTSPHACKRPGFGKALHVFFGLTKDFQQMTHLLPQWGTTEALSPFPAKNLCS